MMSKNSSFCTEWAWAQEEDFTEDSNGTVGIVMYRRTRANSVGAQGHSTPTSGTPGPSDDSEELSGPQTPPSRPLSMSGLMKVRRRPMRQQKHMAAALQRKMEEMCLAQESISSDDEGFAHEEAKSSAVTATVLTFMVAMLGTTLSPCLPTTHLHLSRLPIGTGHSVIIDALRREYPGRDFDIKLHVYQKTRHVSGVAAVSPGVEPSDLERLRAREDTMFLPLANGESMIVEESKRDRNPALMSKYKQMVLAGLGVPGLEFPPLVPYRKTYLETPIVYLRVMGDRTQLNTMLSQITDVKDEGILYLLERYAVPDGMDASESVTGLPPVSVADLVRLVAPDKSTNQMHMHPTHFGRAFFLECTSEKAAVITMTAIQGRSVQSVDGIQFSLHVELKKPKQTRTGETGRLFEQDPERRAMAEHRLGQARQVVETLVHKPCKCVISEMHSLSLHRMFTFTVKAYNKMPMYSQLPMSSSMGSCPSMYTESCCESVMGDYIPDNMSACGTEYSEEPYKYQQPMTFQHQPHQIHPTVYHTKQRGYSPEEYDVAWEAQSQQSYGMDMGRYQQYQQYPQYQQYMYGYSGSELNLPPSMCWAEDQMELMN